MSYLTDLRYLQTVKGYSLGAVAMLLERLNAYIDAENGIKNETTGRSDLFFDGCPNTIDKKTGVFRYTLETKIIAIFRELSEFHNDQFRSFDQCKPRDITAYFLEYKKGVNIPEVKSDLAPAFSSFYHLGGNKFAGLTLNEWNRVFGSIVEQVDSVVRDYIPDFVFEVKRIHDEDICKKKHNTDLFEV